MSTLLKLLLIVGVIIVVGYVGCRSTMKVSGTDISENMCSPYLSNGSPNQQYQYAYRSCSDSCGRSHKSGILNTKSCDCNCI